MHARSELRRVALDRILERLQEQGYARKLLTQSIVQIVADSLVLALADFANLGLELANLAREIV